MTRRLLRSRIGDADERATTYRFDDLGWLQFEQLCVELAAAELGIPRDAWTRGGGAAFAGVPAGLDLPFGVPRLPGATLVLVAFVRSAAALRDVVLDADWVGEPASVLVLTNATDELPEPLPHPRMARLGGCELALLLDRRPDVRRRVPFVLGVRGGAVPNELARVFVPTRAYLHALDVLERHRFAVLTGPPEVGKTAIARMLGLALAAEGWELHECSRPDELLGALRRETRQVFVADDAFGSTEYRPDAAERWALDLDRILRALDERHLLIWTSRPAPLRAALRRIHREHGVEHWPQPAEVQVAASELDVAEKALILFRHAQAAALPTRAVTILEAFGWEIVSHPHFTPERIRRFVGGRLLELPDGRDAVAAAIEAEIREPTIAMAVSLRALDDEHRGLLVALLDAPPGLVSERDLAAAARRHHDGGFTRAPAELVERLAEHFLRVVPPGSVTWVHPSWRDLVIRDLAADERERRRFLERCGLDGLLLAVSVAGGAAGERSFPLLVADADWDIATARLSGLVAEIDDHDLFRLLASLAVSVADPAAARTFGDVQALAHEALRVVARRWDGSGAPVAPTLLDAWFSTAAAVADPPEAPQLARTWIELLPTESLDLASAEDVAAFDDWIRLAAVLPAEVLADFGFPDAQRATLWNLLEGLETAPSPLLAEALRRLGRLVPEFAPAASRLVAEAPPSRVGVSSVPPARPTSGDRRLVARILRDLRPG